MKKFCISALLLATLAMADTPTGQVGLDLGWGFNFDKYVADSMKLSNGFNVGLDGKFFLNTHNAIMASADLSLLSHSDSGVTLTAKPIFIGIGHSFRYEVAPNTSLITEELIGMNLIDYGVSGSGFDTSFSHVGWAYRLGVGVEQQVGVVALQAKVRWTGGSYGKLSTIDDLGNPYSVSVTANRLNLNLAAVLGFK